MKTYKIITGLMLALSLFSVSASANADDSAQAEITAKLKAMSPATRFDSVKETPLPGVYEVTMGRNIAYTTRDATHLIFGAMWDIAARRDITADRREEIGKLTTDSLKATDAIIIRKGNGKRQLSIFTDIDCPFCRRLEGELSKIDDVTLHYYLMPADALHPQAARKSIAIWCATDRPKSLRDAMQGKDPGNAQCDHPLERVAALSKQFGISATPTLVRADGAVKPGYLAADQLERWLDGGK